MYHYIDNLSRSIGFSTEIVLDLIPKIYDTARVARIVGEDGEPDHCKLCVGQGRAVVEKIGEDGEIEKIYDPSIGTYDVVVSVGPSFLTKRLEAAEFLTQTAQAAKDPVTAQVITYLALKSQDWPGANEAAGMIKKLLPPQIVEDENAKKNDPEVMQQQMQMAAQKLGEREAQLNGVQEEMALEASESEQKMQAATDQENKAKDAMRRVEAEVEKLNTLHAQLEAERELFTMQKQLAQKELEVDRTTAKAEKDVIEAEIKVLQERMESKLAELNNASETAQRETQVSEGTAKIVGEFAEQIKELLEVAGADRELIIDPDTGEPVGSRPVRKAA